MKHLKCTDLAIAELVDASCHKSMSPRERRLFKESLHNLVRLAQSELLVEMRRNVCQLTGLTPLTLRRPRTGLHLSARPLQQRFEFNQP